MTPAPAMERRRRSRSLAEFGFEKRMMRGEKKSERRGSK
jgi:hypothetical protein